MMESDVSNILEQYKKGLTKDYDILVSQLNDPTIESEKLASYLSGLRDCVSKIGQEFEVLVDVLLRVDWSSHGPAVAHEYRLFIVNLVSAHTVFLKACLRSLVLCFYPKPCVVKCRQVPQDIREKDEERFVNAHLVLKSIAQIIPMMSTVLLPQLTLSFPYLSKDAYFQECYVKNLLQTTHYAPRLRQSVLELIVDRMLKIDVRCPRQLIEEAESPDAGDDDQADIFDMDSADVTAEMRHLPDEMRHPEANKLDCMMELVLRYVQGVCHDKGELNWERTKLTYREFLLIFERVIFPTHASCHVQFIMFYLCSLKQPLCEGFLDYLWKRVTSPNTDTVYRQAAVAYIASLISRGRFVPVSTLKACLELMSCWAHRYLDQASHTTRADVRHHGPFYSVCQALFYVFAFRHRDLLETDKGYKWAKCLNLQTLVTSRLNPLRFCLPVIVVTFSSVTRSHQLAFCDTIIERNNRARLPETSAEHSTLSDVNALDSFFPFDPYLLLRSGRVISPLYREYEGQSPEVENMDSEPEEDDFLPEPEHTEGFKLPSFGKSPVDFLSYGTSPGFKHV